MKVRTEEMISSSTQSSKSIHTSDQAISRDPANIITINEKVALTKDQYEVLTICDVYGESVSDYMQEALV